jgi:hypothetical protein
MTVFSIRLSCFKGLQAFRPDLFYSIDRDSFQRESANIRIQNCDGRGVLTTVFHVRLNNAPKLMELITDFLFGFSLL